MFLTKFIPLPRPTRAAASVWIFAMLGSLVGHAHATTVVPPEFPTLVNESDYIIHAVTKSVSSEKRTTPRGTKIYTRVELEIIEVIAGHPPAHVTLEFLGGQVGEERMTIEGTPRFTVGDEDILFVSGNGRSICPLYGMMHGRYLVGKETATGRQYVARSDGEPLQNTAQIASSMETESNIATRHRAAAATALGPAEFVREIKATVRPGARVLRAP